MAAPPTVILQDKNHTTGRATYFNLVLEKTTLGNGVSQGGWPARTACSTRSAESPGKAHILL
jgi:hypothetical protein